VVHAFLMKKSNPLNYSSSATALLDTEEPMQAEEEIGEDEVRFCCVNLNKGFRPVNLLGLFLLKFILDFTLIFAISFSTQILVQNFNLSQKEAGEKIAKVSVITEIISIILFVPIGFTMDYYGRKVLMVFGLLLSSIGLVSGVFAGTIYPGFLLARIAS